MKMRRMTLALCAVLVAAQVLGMEAWALAPGKYLVSNTTYYVNPDTGATDDGSDPSTGEAMCRNATYTDSFYEYSDGKHYVTMRLKLSSFLSSVSFSAQGTAGDSDSYSSVSHTVTGSNTDEDTKDYRFQIPAEGSLIKASFYVGPMSRTVTYYIKLNTSQAQKDDGTFAAFNGVLPESEPDAEAEGTAASAASLNTAAGAENTGEETAGAVQASGSGAAANTQSEGSRQSADSLQSSDGKAADGGEERESVKGDGADDDDQSGDSSSDDGSSDEGSTENDGDDDLDHEREEGEDFDSTPDKKTENNGGGLFIAVIILAATAAGGVFYWYKRKRA